MLVDITFKPFTADQIEFYRFHAEAHNRHNPLDPMPLEMTHPARLDRGIYVSDGNLSLRSIEQYVVEDVPEYRDYKKITAGGTDNYFEDHRQWKRAMDRLYSQKYHKGPYRDWGGYGAYGLCDSPEQFLAMYPHIQDDNVARFCTFYGIMREHQDPVGGFRYHKHGNYLGKQRPRHEYLYDDTHIDMICGFHVYRVDDLISG